MNYPWLISHYYPFLVINLLISKAIKTMVSKSNNKYYSNIKKFYIKSTLFFKLGICSVAEFKLYNVKRALGYFEKKLPVEYFIRKNIFTSFLKNQQTIELDLDDSHNDTFFFNDKFLVNKSGLYNPYVKEEYLAEKHWSKINNNEIFFKPGSDIKAIWEYSRFYWLVSFACSYKEYGDNECVHIMQARLQCWQKNNPYNQGINWLCAQEVSIRLVNMLLASSIFNSSEHPEDLVGFVTEHAERIIPAMSYARVQKNNHSLSEAVALYFCGAWLLSTQTSGNNAIRYLKIGKKNLEKQLGALVMDDGTFSQYSITYHCLVVEIISLTLWIQQKFDLPPFSIEFVTKSTSALNWLCALVDPVSFDAPNLGSNDSTALFKLDDLNYRDIRARLQILSVLLKKERVFVSGLWDSPMKWLDIEYESIPVNPIKQVSKEFKDGGLVKFIGGSSWALLRYPRFKFRPSQADCMHFDLWVSGINVLRDNGTYSYNAKPETRDYFRGIEAHNTIQFDNKQPMPMLSRFLFGDWAKTTVDKPLTIIDGKQIWSGYYIDTNGCYHKRTVLCESNCYTVTDKIDKYKDSAIIRWHLADLEWQYLGDAWESNLVRIKTMVNGMDSEPVRYQSEQSLYYHSKVKKPAIQLEIKDCPAIVETQIHILV